MSAPGSSSLHSGSKRPPPVRPPRRARVIATYAAMALTVIILAGCGEAPRNAASESEGPGEVDAFALQVGDCYDDPTLATENVTGVAGVPCDEPHDNEVFALFDIERDTFPGDSLTLALGNRGCLEHFAEYVGTTYAESRLAINTLVPSAGSWEELGDREVVCIAFLYDLSKLTGSVRGTGM